MKSFFPVDLEHKKKQKRDRRNKVYVTKIKLRDNELLPPASKKESIKDTRQRSKAAQKSMNVTPEEQANLKNVLDTERKRAASKDPPKNQILTRINHSNDQKMQKAVADWDAHPREGSPSKSLFAKEMGINTQTFQKYVTDDVSKRRKIGGKVGRASLVTKDSAEFLIQNTIRADRANDGHSKFQVMCNLMDIQPELAPDQAKNYINRTWKKNTRVD